MKGLKFEYRISLAYLLIGAAWILLSDILVEFIAINFQLNMSNLQTAKGWFYVLATALLLLFFIRKHLGRLRETEAELEKHRMHLSDMVTEKTQKLDQAVEELKNTNDTLLVRNTLIDSQNRELMQAINDLRSTQAQLAQADRMAAIGVLTSGIVHEVKLPLKTIEESVNELNQNFGQNESTKALFLKQTEKIQTSLNRISKITSGLKQLSSSEYSSNEKCDLHTILDNCLAILNYHLAGRIRTIRNYANDELVVKGNPGQLHQAFISILINAEQAISGEGEIEIETSADDKGLIHLSIRDNGCGIDEPNLPHITDPFFTTKEPGTGSGLGLSISYTILKNHGGELAIQSKKNEGTTVHITLPQSIQ